MKYEIGDKVKLSNNKGIVKFLKRYTLGDKKYYSYSRGGTNDEIFVTEDMIEGKVN